jgi:hypothetical protein
MTLRLTLAAVSAAVGPTRASDWARSATRFRMPRTMTYSDQASRMAGRFILEHHTAQQ